MKAKPFNVTLIVSPDYPHSLALAEVGEYLAHLIGRCGLKAELSTNAVSGDFHNVILCGHMLRSRRCRTIRSFSTANRSPTPKAGNSPPESTARRSIDSTSGITLRAT